MGQKSELFDGFKNSLEGLKHILSSPLFNHAAHQWNEVGATAKCLHLNIRKKSSKTLFDKWFLTKVKSLMCENICSSSLKLSENKKIRD